MARSTSFAVMWPILPVPVRVVILMPNCLAVVLASDVAKSVGEVEILGGGDGDKHGKNPKIQIS